MTGRIIVSLFCSLLALASGAQQQTQRLHYWGNADNYRTAQGQVMLEQIDHTLDLYQPTAENVLERRLALYNFDAILHDTFYDTTKVLHDFAARRAAKVVDALDKPAKEGLEIYKIYNDGFILRTKSVCVAIDLNSRNGRIIPEALMEKLADHCQALFITHNHPDHYDQCVKHFFLNSGKPVYAVDEFEPDNRDIIHVRGEKAMDLKLKLEGARLKVKVFPGHQGKMNNNIYVITFPEGYTVAHTGDQYNEEDMPWIKTIRKEIPPLDVLIMECWIHHVPEIIEGFSPKTIVTGHENEMGHTIDHREAFWLTFYKMEEVYQVSTPYVVMSWGERFLYE